MESVSSQSSLNSDPSTTVESAKAKPHEKPVMSIEVDLVTNLSNTLEQILGVLRTSSIAEERSNDVKSKFWATYKKVSDGYDDDFLARAHGDIGIILTFAGLLSATISTFIGGMQPDSGNTTNILLMQLIQISVNGSSANIGNLSSTTRYSTSTIWAQALAYIGLALSILAAFGAVVVKQCLYSFEATRKLGGSLEESGMRRQKNLDRLEHLRLRTFMQAFLVLLQVALLLFSISLCLQTWTDPQSTFGVMVFAAASVVLFCAGTIFLLAWWQDNPVQISWTGLVQVIGEFRRAMRSTSTSKLFPNPDKSSPVPNKSSPICWILETSTNQEAVEAAVAMVHLTQWSPNLDVSAAFQRLRDNFEACCNKEELYVKFGKAMAHLCIQPVKIDTTLVDKLFRDDMDKFRLTRNRFIRDAFMAGYDAYCHFVKAPPPEKDISGLKPKHRATARTALRTMVVYALDYHLSLPDNEKLIWNGNLCWSHGDGREPDCEEFDWLVDYLADEVGHEKADEIGHEKADEKKHNKADEIGDALLALSAMRGLGSPAKRSSYIKSLIRCMPSTRPPRVRHAALRTVYEVRGELASIIESSIPEGIDTNLLDELSAALFTAMHPDDELNASRNLKYIHIIFSMTRNHEWCQRLASHNNLQRCINLVTTKGLEMYQRDAGFYLAVIIGRLYPMSKKINSRFDFQSTQSRPWWKLIKYTWINARLSVELDADYINGIPDLAIATRCGIFPGARPVDIATKVQVALDDLKNRKENFEKNGVTCIEVEAAISSVQSLCNYLGGAVEQSQTP